MKVLCICMGVGMLFLGWALFSVLKHEAGDPQKDSVKFFNAQKMKAAQECGAADYYKR